MATHSSVLAWRIPGTVEPDGLPSWVHTQSDMIKHTHTHTHTHKHAFTSLCGSYYPGTTQPEELQTGA